MRRRFSIVAVIVASGLAGTAVGETWSEHYAMGSQASDAQRWRLAIEHLTQAIELREEPALGVSIGDGREIDYLPYLRLGIAFYNLGQYEAAAQAFDTEEGFGTIAGSSPDSIQLSVYSELVGKATGRSGTEATQVDSFVADTLETATRQELDGELEAAMASVGRVLAVDRDNARAVAAMERLRNRVTELETQRDEEARRTGLLDEGQRLAAAGDDQEALSRFRRAAAIRPGADVQDMVAAAQSRLRTLEKDRDPGSRRQLVDDRIGDAARHEAAGRVADALETLQLVLALEPSNEQALALHARLFKQQQRAERQRILREQVDTLLTQAEEHFAEARFDQTVAVLNLALALDSDEARAVAMLDSALASLQSQNMAAVGPAELFRIPPSIALVRAPGAAPRTTESGERLHAVERVTSPQFVVRGMVFDDRHELTLEVLNTDASGGLTSLAKLALNGTQMGEHLYRFDFAPSVELRTGSSELTVRAIDGDGLSSETVQLVRYERPLLRSPWFYSAVGAIALFAVGSYRYVKARRHRRLRRRRYNPYIAGAPVLDDERFFGRRRLMLRVLQSVHLNSLLLYGERRIGKTSFLHRLKRRLEELNDPEYAFFPVFIDLQGVRQEQFFQLLGTEILEQLAPIVGDREAPRDGYGFTELVRDVRDCLRLLKGTSAKRVKLALLIDEVDELNAYDPKINQKLRSLFMKSFAEDLVAVVTGVSIKKDWSSEGSPWYNFFDEIEVTPFTREDAADLVVRPIRGVFELEDGVVDRVLTQTECRPYLIQKICIQLVNRMHQEGRSRITVADVEQVGPVGEQ